MHFANQLKDGLLLAEAAQIAGRSLTWVRRHRRHGPLVPVEIAGRQGVTASSLNALLRDARKPVKNIAKKRRSHLRLIVDNTK